MNIRKILIRIIIALLLIIISNNVYSKWLGIEITGDIHTYYSIYGRGGYGTFFLNPELSIIAKTNKIFRNGFFKNIYIFFDIGVLKGKRIININLNDELDFKDQFNFRSTKINYCIGYCLKFKTISYIPFIGLVKINIIENAFKEEIKTKLMGIKIGLKTEFYLNKKRTFNFILKVGKNQILKGNTNVKKYFDYSAGINIYLNPFKRRFF